LDLLEAKLSSTSDLNILLRQGDAVKEMYNARRENLDLNQQFVAQKAENKEREERSKVPESEPENRVEMSLDEKRQDTDGKEGKGKGSREPREEKPHNISGESVIDIRI